MEQKLKIVALLWALLWAFESNGQTYSGFVYADGNVEKQVAYAKIFFVDLGTTIYTDQNGKWEITDAPEGNNHIIVSAVGFGAQHFDIELSSETPAIIYLASTHHQLDKVLVSNNGYLHRESITNIESHQLADLNTIQYTTVGEALTNIPGVYQTGIGTGISKPVIRGLSGSSVITYINSLRIQNQQWGGDHGLPVTSLGIGGVEIIKGPASLLYGADAMGGVLYFVDEPYEARNTLSGYVRTRFEHNSLGTSNEAGVRFSKNSFKMNVYGQYDNFADYGIPNGMQILNSRFNQYAGKLALGYSKKKWVLNLRYSFYQARIGIPGHTHDSVPDPSSFLTTNQNRGETVPAQIVQNHFVSVENKFFFKDHEIMLTLGNTNNSLKELEEQFFFPEIILNLNNSLYNLKWRNKISVHWESIIGSQGMLQINRNGTGASQILIPDGQTTDAGIYALLRADYNNWRVMFGGRFDHRTINTENQDNFSGNYNGISYSAGTAYLGKLSTVRLNVSSGFRAPTTSELLSDGVHHGSFRYEIGNASLQTEKAIQLDASFALHFEDLELIVNPFFNYITDYIYIQQTDSLIDNYKVYEYVQADYAFLYGTDFGFHYHPHFAHWLHIENSFSTVFAEDKYKAPLPLIPQSRINTQIKIEFKMKGKFLIENLAVQHVFLFKQNRLGILETESPSYHLVNLGVNMKVDLKKPLYISTGVRNILNEEYIDHLSGLKNLGLPGPGINVYCAIRYEFSNHLNNKQK